MNITLSGVMREIPIERQYIIVHTRYGYLSKVGDGLLSDFSKDIADAVTFTNFEQVKTLCDELEDKAASLGLDLLRKEGYNEGRWIVLDFGHILVHIFHPEERQYYHLERLWEDGAGIDYSKEYGQP